MSSFKVALPQKPARAALLQWDGQRHATIVARAQGR
jgi:hypothetical protein